MSSNGNPTNYTNPMPGCIPCWSINTPGAGSQGPPMVISNHQPVYSTYSGVLVGHGPIPYGMPGDAPAYHPNYGKDFHVVEYNPANGSYMAHRASSSSVGHHHGRYKS